MKHYWAQQFGFDRLDFDMDLTMAVASPSKKNILFRHKKLAILSAPEKLIASLSPLLNSVKAGELFEAKTMNRLFGARTFSSSGSIIVSSLYDISHLESYAPQLRVRILGKSNISEVNDFLGTFDSATLKTCSISGKEEILVGGFFGPEGLASLAACETLSEDLAEIKVLTAPAYRGKGYAKETFNLAGRVALDQGYTVQYRAARENIAARRLAKIYDFSDFAEIKELYFKDADL